MARKLTHEQFIERLYKRNENAENIEILEQYINSRTPILCKCKIDGHEWSPKPNSLLNGQGCPKCSGNAKKTHEEFIKELNEINSNIEVLGEYKNNKTPILCKCKIDGHEWSPKPNNLLEKESGCPMCYGHLVLTHEQFIERLYKRNENAENIEVLGEYINSRTPILCKCKIDGHEWSPTPNNLLDNGQGCPKCNTSKGEKVIAKYLEEHNINFKDQHRFDDCKFNRQLPFDFYIPSLNIAIEFDGKDHYEIFIRSNNETYEEATDRFIDRKIRDTIKTIYCEKNNIRLIRIPYWEFSNIENILDKIFKI